VSSSEELLKQQHNDTLNQDSGGEGEEAMRKQKAKLTI